MDRLTRVNGGVEAALRDIPVVILCGGEGTRFHEESQYRPKPLAEVGGRPILHHIMQIYARYGCRRFILCLGYKGGMIKQFFLSCETSLRDFTLRLGDSAPPQFLDNLSADDWEISFVDTGLKTMTGGRIKRIERLIETEHFMLTYGDGLANVDVGALLEFHLSHGAIGTVTGVQSNSQFGELNIDGDRVRAFAEKPKIPSVINGGFFVFKRIFFDYLRSDDDCVLEREPLTLLANDGQLRVFRHNGFWQCMDTFKDYLQLNEFWSSGSAPWLAASGRAR
jgi:glucose-1-phosphate cytidylyltransferase